MKNEELIHEILDNIFGFMKVSPKVEVTVNEDEFYDVTIQGNDLSFLIGFRGQSLDGLQTIVSLAMLKKLGKPVSVSIDINQYKNKKVEKILDMAKSFIDKVRFFEKEVQLPAMNPWERRQIHLMISEYSDIESESVGEGSQRRVVLKPKKR